MIELKRHVLTELTAKVDRKKKKSLDGLSFEGKGSGC